ncbi:MAG TPA: shikimate kinase [Cyanobacteria bacterium UBA8803]|nr:shikimate kinase [Cyanobacteria bacterium UBA9273]HBL60314.1 shikimate kinase [Cyanobacteria bacterium UBA8803]
MMGAGKTTVGRLLAAELGYRFFDTDELIELVVEKTINQKKTIKQIFADDGEETFRNLETNVLSDLSAYTKSIVATGGGIVLRPINWSYLHHGLVVWLDVPIEVLIERLQNDTARPLLQNPDPGSALQKLLDQRRSLYAEADLHIRVSASDTSEQIVARLIAEIPTVLKSAAIDPKNN